MGWLLAVLSDTVMADTTETIITLITVTAMTATKLMLSQVTRTAALGIALSVTSPTIRPRGHTSDMTV